MKYKNEKLVLDPTREFLIIGEYVDDDNFINIDEKIIIHVENFDDFKLNNKEYICNEYIVLVYADNLTEDYRELLMENILLNCSVVDILRLTNTTELTLKTFIDYGNDSKRFYNIPLENDVDVLEPAGDDMLKHMSSTINNTVALNSIELFFNCKGAIENLNSDKY